MLVKTTLLHRVEPITAKLVANMLVKAGIDRVLTLRFTRFTNSELSFDIPVDNTILP